MCNVPPVWSGCKASRCGNGKRYYSTYRSESYVWNPQYDERSGYDKNAGVTGNLNRDPSGEGKEGSRI